MLSLSEGFLFVWEPTYLVMSWHAPSLPNGRGGEEREISVKKSCGGLENFDFKEGFRYGTG